MQGESADGSSIKGAAAVQFAELVGRLKTTPRTGWVRRGVPRCESVADHSWRVAALCFLLNPTHLDISKCIQLALVHDMAECIVGDIAPGDNISKQEKARLESNAMAQLVSTLQKSEGAPAKGADDKPVTLSSEYLRDLFHEYEERLSPESIAVKDLDLLDMILQAVDYENTFDLNLNEFFESAPVEKFQTPEIAETATVVHNQHENIIEQLQKLACNEPADVASHPTLSESDQAFLVEHSKASTLNSDSIEQVIRALRMWENGIPS